MSLKFPVFLFITLLVITACSASVASAPTPTPLIQENLAITVPAEPTTSGTVATSVPKHKDLIFVEFFAVT